MAQLFVAQLLANDLHRQEMIKVWRLRSLGVHRWPPVLQREHDHDAGVPLVTLEQLGIRKAEERASTRALAGSRKEAGAMPGGVCKPRSLRKR